MTSKSVAPPAAARPAGQFPEFPPRDDMQNALHLDDPGHQAALRRHLAAPLTTVVLSEVPVGWNIHTRREHLRVPDLLIAFNVDRALVVAEMGYSIDEHGKAPDFVLEIASPHTARNDEVGKRIDYARFGVLEYWRFDATGGRLYRQALAGDRLVNGVYQPIDIVRVDADRHWGHSAALNLVICWEYGKLRWYDPVARRYLRTYDDADDARRAAELQRDTERQARRAAELQRDTERQTRLAAEARIQQLQAEIRRLQNPWPPGLG